MFEDKELDLVASATNGKRNAPYELTVKVVSAEDSVGQDGKPRMLLHCTLKDETKGYMYASKRLTMALRPFKLGELVKIERSGEGFDTQYKVSKVKG